MIISSFKYNKITVDQGCWVSFNITLKLCSSWLRSIPEILININNPLWTNLQDMKFLLIKLKYGLTKHNNTKQLHIQPSWHLNVQS